MDENKKGWIRQVSLALLLVVYLALVVANAFGLAEIDPAQIDQLVDLLSIFGGGYIASRGLEKVARIFRGKGKDKGVTDAD